MSSCPRVLLFCISVKPEPMRLCTSRTYPRIGDGTWLTPYISCNYSYRSRTTRIVVELVGIEGNYPNTTRVGLLGSYPTRTSI
jgi:hypothetical protein